MKKVFFWVAISFHATFYAQISGTSFEDPEVFTEPYTDTGDASVAHDLLNNPNEALVDHISTVDEIGFDARYIPYDIPGEGLTDGDAVGVTTDPPSTNEPFPHGNNGYMISDVDGNFVVEFDPVTVTSPTISIEFYISETGYEGDGTTNSSGSDRLRIYVKDLTHSVEYDLFDTTGNDINNLGVEGMWNTATTSIPGISETIIQVVIEARNNSSAEAFYFDNLNIEWELGIKNDESTLFHVYPNPCSDVLYISSPISDDTEVVIFDILGVEVLRTNLKNNTLNTSHLKSGLYLLNILQGSKRSTQKIVIY